MLRPWQVAARVSISIGPKCKTTAGGQAQLACAGEGAALLCRERCDLGIAPADPGAAGFRGRATALLPAGTNVTETPMYGGRWFPKGHCAEGQAADCWCGAASEEAPEAAIAPQGCDALWVALCQPPVCPLQIIVFYCRGKQTVSMCVAIVATTDPVHRTSIEQRKP